MINQLKVQDLFKLCEQEIKKGNAQRILVISDDNEGNGFHGLFYGFTEIAEQDKEYFPIYDSVETDIKKILVLG